jgi:5'-nucleotidase
MSQTANKKLVIAIASRALFDLTESHQVYETKGVEAYSQYQVEHENEILQPGVAFPLVQKLLALNKGQELPLVEVILLSRNSADTGLRIFNSINHYKLNMVRAAFTGGESPYAYVYAFDCHLFLSANPEDVRQALCAGCAAATIFSKPPVANETAQLRIAFDGDSVLFSDASERIYQSLGLAAFADNEVSSADIPLEGGPFKPFLTALHKIQQSFPADNCPLRTALVTARSAPSHERVIKTLRSWNIRIDEALFLGGMPKSEFLKAFRADFFFDDQTLHCDSASAHTATGHVPHGVMNG